MIHHLTGSLLQKSPTRAVVDVGGVGYGVSISLSTYAHLGSEGDPVRLFIHTYVREDRLELFGFSEPAEREMFQLLIGVSGIGPNSAQAILSGMSVADLQRAIHQEEVSELTRVRGVGPKTARRVVVELKDKIRIPALAAAEPVTTSSGEGLDDQASLALEALGIATATARKAVASARAKLDGEPTVQALIKAALRER